MVRRVGEAFGGEYFVWSFGVLGLWSVEVGALILETGESLVSICLISWSFAFMI